MDINFPNSRQLPMTTADQKLPENKRPIPLTEKNAPHPAKSNADNPNNSLNTV